MKNPTNILVTIITILLFSLLASSLSSSPSSIASAMMKADPEEEWPEGGGGGEDIHCPDGLYEGATCTMDPINIFTGTPAPAPPTPIGGSGGGVCCGPNLNPAGGGGDIGSTAGIGPGLASHTRTRDPLGPFTDPICKNSLVCKRLEADEKLYAQGITVRPSACSICISDHSLQALSHIMGYSGQRTITISDTFRNAAQQADRMYKNQYNSNKDIKYSEPGKEVLKVYTNDINQHKAESEIKKDMTAKIEELSSRGVTVSLHMVSLDKLNVIDVAKSSIAFPNDFENALKDAKNNHEICGYIPEQLSFHIVIPQRGNPCPKGL